MTFGNLKFYLSGNFNEIDNGKERVGKMIRSSGKGNVSDTLKGSDILVIGSFPGTSNIKDAEKKGIKIIDYAILQQGLQPSSPMYYFLLKNNNIDAENARRRCFQPGDEQVEIQSGDEEERFNFFYQPNVITELEEFEVIEYLELLKDSIGNLVFKKNETRQSFGCGAEDIEYKADNGKLFTECDWINFLPLKNLVDKISKLSGIKCNFLVIQYYPKGSAYMGAHKDKEVDDNLPIIGISLGKSVRLLRLARENYTAIHVQQLLPRSMYQLRPPTNTHFTHAIIKSDDVDENERWSLNLRYVKKK